VLTQSIQASETHTLHSNCRVVKRFFFLQKLLWRKESSGKTTSWSEVVTADHVG